MERVESSPDDYIASQPSDIRVVLEELHTLIKTALPDRECCMWEGVFWGGSEQQIIGYGDYSYQRSDKTQVEWFIVGLTRQKIISVCMSMRLKEKPIWLSSMAPDSAKSRSEKVVLVFVTGRILIWMCYVRWSNTQEE